MSLSSTKKLNVLITAGPTREYIDPVRFISNKSSGKMGYSLAECARKDGAGVTVVSGPVNIDAGQLKTVCVETAGQMFSAVKSRMNKADIFISCAAVCDFKPAEFTGNKIKKNGRPLIVKLVQTPDILRYVSEHISNRENKIVAGFALETETLIKNSLKKMASKKLDAIIANTCSNIGSDSASGFILNGSGRKKINKTGKRQFARAVWSEIKKLYERKKTNN